MEQEGTPGDSRVSNKKGFRKKSIILTEKTQRRKDYLYQPELKQPDNGAGRERVKGTIVQGNGAK